MAHNVAADSTNAQDPINDAINDAAGSGDVIVHLGEGEFVISEPIVVKSNLTFEGVGTKTVIKLAPGLRWPGTQDVSLSNEKSMIQSASSGTLTNLILRNFKMDGNNRSYPEDYEEEAVGRPVFRGQKYYTFVRLVNATNSKISGITLYDGTHDGFLLCYPNNVEVYNCVVDKCGHDGVYCSHGTGVSVHDNKFINRTNSSTRFEYSTDCKFYNNDCSTGAGGWGGVEITYAPGKNLEIYNNFFHDLIGPGVFTVEDHGAAVNVQIHHNIFKNCATSLNGYAVNLVGAASSGVNQVNSGSCYCNIFDKNNADGAIRVTNGTLDVKKNIFTGNDISIYNGGTLTVDQNCFFGNSSNPKTGTGAITGDPKYTNAAANDYTLKSGGSMDALIGSEKIGIGATATPVNTTPTTPPTTTPTTPAATGTGATLHVGPGQTYNGTTQVALNNAMAAAKSGDTIYIHAATYNFTSRFAINKSGIFIKGDGDSTIIKGTADTCNTEDSNSAYFYADGVSNVQIYNLAFHSTSNAGSGVNGIGDKRYCMKFAGCTNITVHNCKVMDYVYNDFIKHSSCKNIVVYNCSGRSGHSFVYGYQSTGGRCYNNIINVAINAGLRCDGWSGYEFDHNTIYCQAGGQAAIEYQHAVAGNVHHNVIYDMSNNTSGKCVTQNAGGASGTVNFHDNAWWNCSGGVQYGSGTGNFANTSNHDVADWKAQGYGANITSTPDPDPDSNPDTDPEPEPDTDPDGVTKIEVRFLVAVVDGDKVND